MTKQHLHPSRQGASLLPVLLLLLTLPAAAQAQFSYDFTPDFDAIIITGYTGPGGAVVIPDTIDELPVTSIAAFNCPTTVTSVTIPNSVTNIGQGAFFGCISLTNVTIGNSVTSIGNSAFSSCTSLTSVTIPNSVTSIGESAFHSCTSLSGVTIPNSVTSIGHYAFDSCTSLSNVTIGDSVTSIAYRAFAYCTNLTSVTIPTSVITIEGGAFGYCTSLTSVTIPNSVISIGDGWVFADGPFESCLSLTNVTIGNSVTIIGNSAFSSCTKLTSVMIPNSVTNIGPATFFGCTSLSAITVDALNSVYSSVDGVLFNKSQTLLIKHPQGKTGIYTIPNSVTSIGVAAFYGCTSLTGVYFQGSAPSVDSSVFLSATNATVYYLPGTTGWGTTFAGRPAVLWNPLVETSDANFGVRTNRFGFTITGTSNLVLVVEACTNLTDPTWSVVGTNTLTGGSSYFSDPEWTNHPGRFYRLRSP